MISIKSQKWHMQWSIHMDSVRKLDKSISGKLGPCSPGLRTAARWYNFETLPQMDDLRRAAVESAHIVQSVHPIARWEAK